MTRRTARIPPAGSPVDPGVAALSVLTDLGHRSMRIGTTFECWHCAHTGYIQGSLMTGPIFEEKCK